MQKFPIDVVREAFPALASRSDAGATIFLDNPAGTQVPGRVADAVAGAMLTASSNLGGYFTQSWAAEGIWKDAHEAMADMLGAATAKEIVIGSFMTALSHERLLPATIAETLGKQGICVWSGHNYAYEPVRHLGLDEDIGVVRIGLAHYNTAAEVERALGALQRVTG